MIASNDRAWWFGASDTSIVMGPWRSDTFWRWWMEKLGAPRTRFDNQYTLAGTHFEHRILAHAGIPTWDRQIKIIRYRLRVNLDGEDSERIFEVKTHTGKYSFPKAHWQQCQVEMFAAKKALSVLDYEMLPEDYDNFFNVIDPQRLHSTDVPFDSDWVNNAYLPRVKYLAKCMKRRRTPYESQI